MTCSVTVYKVRCPKAWRARLLFIRRPIRPNERMTGIRSRQNSVSWDDSRNAPRLPAREIRARLIISAAQRCQGCGWQPPYLD